MGYDIIEHPADIGFRVRGKTLEGAFSEAALALFSIMAEGQCTEYGEARTISVRAEDLDALLYEFLEELLILFETEDFFGVEASVSISSGEGEVALTAAVAGITMAGPGWHMLHDVKAITYHQMSIVEDSDGCTISVIVDI